LALAVSWALVNAVSLLFLSKFDNLQLKPIDIHEASFSRSWL
jgi:hypothetical protein